MVNNVISFAGLAEIGLACLRMEAIEISTKIYAVNEIYKTVGGPSRHELEIREVLDHVKTRFLRNGGVGSGLGL